MAVEAYILIVGLGTGVIISVCFYAYGVCAKNRAVQAEVVKLGEGRFKDDGDAKDVTIEIT